MHATLPSLPVEVRHRPRRSSSLVSHKCRRSTFHVRLELLGLPVHQRPPAASGVSMNKEVATLGDWCGGTDEGRLQEYIAWMLL